jgi:ribosome-associated translation inhibitor RaiA
MRAAQASPVWKDEPRKHSPEPRRHLPRWGKRCSIFRETARHTSADNEDLLGERRCERCLGAAPSMCCRRANAECRNPIQAIFRYRGQRRMQEPLEIAFHNLDSSPALEAEIRERFARLEKLCDRLTACRISVEALHNQHRTGNVYEVHIDMLVPGAELVVSRAPHKAKEKYASPDVRASIRDAFRAAERQLKKYNRQLTGEIKRHEPEFFGQVAEVHPEEDWGYLLSKEGALLYFNRRAVLDGSFDQLERGDAVDYVQADGETGPTAVKVWRKTFPEPQAT